MQGYNIIIVFDKNEEKILMCKRRKDPYLGMYNFVGGKIEPGEDSERSAYRELYEETGISDGDITLRRLMDFTYYCQDCLVEVWVGRLKRNVRVRGDENKLLWSDLEQNFFDTGRYAGEGNIGHMLEQVKMCRDRLFAD